MALGVTKWSDLCKGDVLIARRFVTAHTPSVGLALGNGKIRWIGLSSLPLPRSCADGSMVNVVAALGDSATLADARRAVKALGD